MHRENILKYDHGIFLIAWNLKDKVAVIGEKPSFEVKLPLNPRLPTSIISHQSIIVLSVFSLSNSCQKEKDILGTTV